jgi:hypothetical protein
MFYSETASLPEVYAALRRDGKETTLRVRTVGTDRRREVLVQVANDLGYTVEFKDYCEDAETPGFLGSIAGVVCEHRKAIKVSVKNRDEDDICDILAHEIRHLKGIAVEGEQVGKVGRCGGRRNAFGERI